VRRLIVTEKFNAAVRIATILSDGKAKRTNVEGTSVFEFSQGDDRVRVVGLRGHIINLDYPEALNDWARVDLKELVWAEPQKIVTAGKIGAALKQLAVDADEVIIATDFDREGELIGVEALGLIQEVRPEVRVKRARFSALTKWDIESAFANLVEVDHPLAWSAESRQSVDLAWGAVLTRFLSIASKQLGRDYLSVGRVQSPTLALVVDREREIEDFVPQDYWTLHARFRKDADGVAVEFEANHEHGPYWAHQEAEAAFELAERVPQGLVREYIQNEREERPPPPFNTTMFVAEANRIGFGAAQAMKIAEDLYQSGYISYPRTDNTVYPSTVNLRTVLEKLQDSSFAAEARVLAALPGPGCHARKAETERSLGDLRARRAALLRHGGTERDRRDRGSEDRPRRPSFPRRRIPDQGSGMAEILPILDGPRDDPACSHDWRIVGPCRACGTPRGPHETSSEVQRRVADPGNGTGRPRDEVHAARDHQEALRPEVHRREVPEADDEWARGDRGP